VAGAARNRRSPHARIVNLETWERVQEMPRSASQRRLGKRGKVPLLQSGTDLAIYNSSKSARPFPALRSSSCHGGARNRADRTSDGLTEKQVRAIFAAVAKASAIGLPLNRHWTVHWTRAGVTDDQACAATGALLTRVRDWLRKHGHRFACVWVRENDMGDGSKGSHVHILLHVPHGARWCGWRNRRWLERVTGRLYAPRTSWTRIVGGSKMAARASPDSFQVNLAVLAGYVAKGAPTGVLRVLGVNRRGSRGAVIGKRWGRSASLA